MRKMEHEECKISGPFIINEGLKHRNALCPVLFSMVKKVQSLTFPDYNEHQNSGAPLRAYVLGNCE